MALANTTLSAAVTSTQLQITVASAASLAPGLFGECDGEIFQITKGYVIAATTVPVLRGQDGTVPIAHPSGAQISWYVLGTDVPTLGAGLSVVEPLSGRGRYITSVTSSAAWTPQVGYQDELVILNGTSVIALTIVNPLRSQTGKVVTFAGNGIAAHTITYTTTGFGNVGTTADVVTFGASQMQTFSMMAVGGFWLTLGPLATATANVSGPSLA